MPSRAWLRKIHANVDTSYMLETYKVVPDDPTIEVSDCGNIRHAHTHQRYTLEHGNTGYMNLRRNKNGKNHRRTVHRLVLMAHNRMPVPGEVCNHKDGNKCNNRLANLEWTTSSGNIRHAYTTGLMDTGENHGAARLTDQQVKEMREDHAGGLKGKALADKYGVSVEQTCRIVNGKSRKLAGHSFIDMAFGNRIGATHPHCKLNPADVLEIREAHSNGAVSGRLAKKYGVSRAAMANVIKGDSFRWLKTEADLHRYEAWKRDVDAYEQQYGKVG
jgi:Mor family transcriptional regulator